MTERTTRRTLLLAFASAVPVAALAGLQGSAAADPVYPSQGDVDAAQSAADAKAAQVASLQAQLAAQQDALDAAQTKLSVAAEDYDEARALLQQRTTRPRPPRPPPTARPPPTPRPAPRWAASPPSSTAGSPTGGPRWPPS